MHVSTTLHSASGWTSRLPHELDSSSTVVFAFGAKENASKGGALTQLRTAFPRSHIIGCSTAGEIHATGIHDGTISVAVARFERTAVQSAFETVTLEGSHDAGVRLAKKIVRPDLRGAFILSAGNDVNGSSLTEGIRSVLGSIPISGGLAGDGTRFGETWVMADGHPRSGVASIVGFYGDSIRLGHGSKGGWDKFGPERRITRAQGNVLYELDGRPALDLYKNYLGELASGLPATALLYPLAIRQSESADQLVRTVLAHSDDDKSLTFAGDMPVGALAQLMRANFDRLVDAASNAASSALCDDVGLCISVSCVGRRLVLGERIEEETEAVGDMLPGCPIVGFYSYGEISPDGDGNCRLHNQTMTLTTFAEV